MVNVEEASEQKIPKIRDQNFKTNTLRRQAKYKND